MSRESLDIFFKPILILLAAATIRLTFHVAKAKFSQHGLKRQFGCQSPARYHHLDPLLGLDALWSTLRAARAKEFLPHVRRQYEKYGNTFSSRFLTYPVLNTIEPANIQSVLSTRFDDYEIGSRRREAFLPLLGRSIILLDGNEWEHSRARLRPTFKRSQVADLARFEVHLQRLIRAIPRDGSTVDLAKLFVRLTQDVATDFMFGESIDSLLRPDSELATFLSAFKEAQFALEERWLLGSLAGCLPQRTFYRNVATIHKYFEQHVEKALEYRNQWEMRKASRTGDIDDASQTKIEDEGRYVFLRELAKSTQNKLVLRDELLSIFLAGRDTTSSLLTNLFFVLARRPDLWSKIYDEVQDLGGALPTLEQMNSMVSIRNSLNESLRLDPPVPSNSRIASKDTVLPLGGGPDGLSPVFVRKGTMIAYHVTAMHRRKDIWGEDACEFKPERWEKETTSWTYLPFNGGPRVCIGQQFALTEATYAVIRLAQHFKEVESRDSLPWSESISITSTSGNGAKVAMISV